MSRLRDPRIEWREGLPYSPIFEDVYFSREGGPAEVEHVFLDGNRLTERFARTAGLFRIGEIGFGTGLNFLVCAQRFLEAAPKTAGLEFVSVEGLPLSKTDLKRALDTALVGHAAQTLSHELIAAYPEPLLPGFFGRELFGGRVRLLLLLGEATEMLSELQSPPLNAWFLDGFAPARNPELWSAALFREVRRLSARETSFATFSAAAVVRDGLGELGFAIEKCAGFANKKHMLRGFLEVGETPAELRPPRSAIVVGGGLAGAAVTRSLARRGVQVTLIEEQSELAALASGNPVGVAVPVLTAEPTHLSRLTRAGLDGLHQELSKPGGDAIVCGEPGALHLGFNEYFERRFERGLRGPDALPAGFARPVNPSEASEIAGLNVMGGGVYFGQALVLRPRALTQLRTSASGVQLLLRHRVKRLLREDGEWLALDAQGHKLAHASCLVLACAHEVENLEMPLERPVALPLVKVRGQLLFYPANDRSADLRVPVCYDGYITPALDGQHCIGATFEHWNTESAIDPEQSKKLHDRAAGFVPAFAPVPDGSDWTRQARVAFRTTSRDRLPIVGALKDAADPRANGLYISTALGSRGLVFSGLAGELTAELILGRAQSIEGSLSAALKPERFVLRAKKKAAAARARKHRRRPKTG
ncbi:MAG: FAD-dependent 5-carboxymethylaminomethyl-2-thiouridine(34) oxidoreductase MnmC [Spirochaetales bacterium]|nr:FAD-dependent 5-carboxymethylaminomethyl-2-thiouridine(34) oxidoreductase MnmC [Leptospiraceae bacterium]MCP5483301.1 FAD-dependent 5-carboxymethylaminomethyl-2-thiouridine(34) oxidoreductase MnmC [Spirochaetales bacterium]